MLRMDVIAFQTEFNKKFAFICFALLTIFLNSENTFIYYQFDRFFASRFKSYFDILKSFRFRKSSESSFFLNLFNKNFSVIQACARYLFIAKAYLTTTTTTIRIKTTR